MKPKETIFRSDGQTVSAEETLATAADIMAQRDVGFLVIHNDGEIVGELTDCDINARVVIAGRDPRTTRIRELLEIA